MLYLDGEGRPGSVVNNLCFPSEVAPSYAPPGQTLVSVSTLGALPELDDAALEAAVRREAGAWFGEGEVGAWRHLRTYRIPFAQPNQVRPVRCQAASKARPALVFLFPAAAVRALAFQPHVADMPKCSNCTRAQAVPTDFFRPAALGGGLFVAGDHRSAATLDGALRSGRVAAVGVARGLGGAAAAAAAGGGGGSR